MFQLIEGKGLASWKNKIVFVSFLAWNVVATVISIGGISAVTDKLRDNNVDTIFVGIDWYIIVTQPILFGLHFSTWFYDWFLSNFFVTFQLIEAVYLTLFAIRTQNALEQVERSSGKHKEAFEALAAGYVLLDIFYVILMIVNSFTISNVIHFARKGGNEEDKKNKEKKEEMAVELSEENFSAKTIPESSNKNDESPFEHSNHIKIDFTIPENEVNNDALENTDNTPSISKMNTNPKDDAPPEVPVMKAESN